MTIHPTQRLFLIVCAVLLIAYVLHKIRKSQMQIEDSIFWCLFATSFVVLALFPQIVFFFCRLLHFDSASNMVFLYVIGVLLIRELSMTAKHAKLRNTVTTMAQQMALKNSDEKDSER